MVFGACTTKKNTVATRAYHNLTSRFNGYFYAKESLKEGNEKLYKTHVDHFDKIIPVFNYTDLKEAQTLTAEMDKAYKKASSVIERHSIYIKGQEHCNWIDDSYLVIGKSHFYRHNYIDALEVFDFMQLQYKKLPSRYEAMLWSFRCQNEVGTSSVAESIMDEINYDKKFPEKLKGEYYAICADHFCKKDDYSFAIENLLKAIPLTKKKRDKTRYTFVLAQLYQKQGQLKKASRYFAEVIKLNPPYEMAFSAKINEARCFDVSSGSTADLKKRLRKMLNDDKNIEYRDQIYYAMAEIADKEKDRERAIDYLHSSIATSTTNTYQKGMSSLKLGDIYLQLPDFKGAQAYYDTAVGLLNPEYPDYDDIVIKSKSLTGLVNDMRTIEREDSLQKIAKLDEAARSKFLENLEASAKQDAELKKEKEEEQKQNEAQQMQQQSMSTGGPGNSMGFPGGTGERGWYFYNQQTLSFGFTEFQKKWGNRKLEDNWRRSNKQQQSLTDDFGGGITQAGGDSTAAADVGDGKGKGGLVYRTKSSFLKDIPLTDAAIKKSNDTIINAYYDMASIYKDQLFFNEKSIQTYEELLRRFPENRYKLSCYFQLYQAYTQAEDEPNALKYKNILLNDYPNSDYALIIRDPNYGKNKAFSKSEATKYYELTYQLFLDQNYSQVLLNCATSDTLFPNSKYKPKYDFLKALCIGKTASLEEYIKSLRLVVAKYPKDEVKTRASDMVEVLLKLQSSQQKQETIAVSDTSKKTIALYNFNSEVEHFCIVLFPAEGTNMAQQKADLSDFNDENFGSSPLNVSDLVFSNEQRMISIKSFANKAKAMEYYGVLKTNETLFKSLANPEKVKILVISSDNYPLLYSKKDVSAYESFFGQKYLQ